MKGHERLAPGELMDAFNRVEQAMTDAHAIGAETLTVEFRDMVTLMKMIAIALEPFNEP